VSGRNRLEIDDVLDEVGNPDGAELIPVRHAVAVHFHLKKEIDSSNSVLGCLELEGFDECLSWEMDKAYPILDELLSGAGVTPEEIVTAVEQEKNRMDKGALVLSANPTTAMIQHLAELPKSLAEHYARMANAKASQKN
jgi:hypothetical protein